MTDFADKYRNLPPSAIKALSKFKLFDALYRFLVGSPPRAVTMAQFEANWSNFKVERADWELMLHLFGESVVKCSEDGVVTLHPPGNKTSSVTKRLKEVVRLLTDRAQKHLRGSLSPTLSDKKFKVEWKRVQTEGWKAVVGEGVDMELRALHAEAVGVAMEAMEMEEVEEEEEAQVDADADPEAEAGKKGVATPALPAAAAAAAAAAAVSNSLNNGGNGDDETEAHKWLAALQAEKFYSGQVSHSRLAPGRQPVYQQLAKPLPAALHHALQANLSIDPAQLYCHQAVCIDAVRQGKHVALSTSTSSGKSLVYNLPVVEACMADPSSVALYLFPTKALAQDQLRALHQLCGNDGSVPVVSVVLDGDTSQQDRNYVTQPRGGNIILTNPDMLHVSVLPNREQYSRLLDHLRFVIIDEAHYYRGAFGSHVACVLRRLLRLVRHPVQFICCSATVASPDKLLKSLVPEHCLRGGVVSAGLELEGSAVGRRLLVMWNPPIRAGAEGSTTAPGGTKRRAATLTAIEPIEPSVWILDRHDKGAEGGPQNAPGDKSSGLESFSAGGFMTAEGAEGSGQAVKAYSVPTPAHRCAPATPSDEAFFASAEDRVRQPASFKPFLPRTKHSLGRGRGGGADEGGSWGASHKSAPRTDDGDATTRGSPIWEAAALLLALIRQGRRVIVFAGTRRLTEYILLSVRRQMDDMKHGAPHKDSVVAYRGGYTKEDRRAIEAKMFSGQISGIIATCALELGVDIGNLDATITLSYPGSISSFRQQIGRAGRRGIDALSIFIPFGDSLVDQYFVRHPSLLFDGKLEDFAVDTANEHVLRGHLPCAAREEPLNTAMCPLPPAADEDGGFMAKREIALDVLIWGPLYPDVVTRLTESKERILTRKALSNNRAIFRYTNASSNQHPALSVALRLIDPISISILDASGPGGGKEIDSVGYSRAFFEVFQGGIYYVQGRQYKVESFTVGEREGRAVVRPSAETYRTSAATVTDVVVEHRLPLLPPDVDDDKGGTVERCLFSYGVVTVRRSVNHYTKLSPKNEVLEVVPLSVESLVTRTKGVWVDFPSAVCSELEARKLDVAASLHTVNHVLAAVAAMTTMCDGDVSCEHLPQHGTRRIMLFDKRPGGLGFCESLLRRHVETVEAAIDLLASCPCESGCVCCTFSNSCTVYNERLSKRGALCLLQLMRAKMREGQSSQGQIGSELSPQSKRRRTNLNEARFTASNHLVIETPWSRLDGL